MAHEQFFYSTLIQEEHALINGSEHQHLAKVMRKTVDEAIWISDGLGTAYYAKIIAINKESTHCKILEKHPGFGEPQNKVSLAVGMIKASHWEIMLEKSVELGVHEIFPLITQHTQTRILKRDRSEKIMLAAMKQSGRSRLPHLHEAMEFDTFLARDLQCEKYICDNQDEYKEMPQGHKDKDYIILIGPEGGFNLTEIQKAKKAHFQAVLLSNRRLRTETAVIKAIGLLSR